MSWVPPYWVTFWVIYCDLNNHESDERVKTISIIRRITLQMKHIVSLNSVFFSQLAHKKIVGNNIAQAITTESETRAKNKISRTVNREENKWNRRDQTLGMEGKNQCVCLLVPVSYVFKQSWMLGLIHEFRWSWKLRKKYKNSIKTINFNFNGFLHFKITTWHHRQSHPSTQ